MSRRCFMCRSELKLKWDGNLSGRWLKFTITCPHWDFRK